MTKEPQALGSNNRPGATGRECVRPNVTLITSTTENSQNLDPNDPCPTQSSSFSLVSFSPNPVQYAITINDLPTFRAEDEFGFVPAAPGPTTPWNTVAIQTFHDFSIFLLPGCNCSCIALLIERGVGKFCSQLVAHVIQLLDARLTFAHFGF